MPYEEHDYNQISKLLPKSKPKGITGVRSKRVSVEPKSRTCTVVGCRHTHTRTREAMLAIDSVGGRRRSTQDVIRSPSLAMERGETASSSNEGMTELIHLLMSMSLLFPS